MKARYQRVTSCGTTHSNDASDNEEVLAVDWLAVKLQTEMAEMNDRDKAELWKAQRKQFLMCWPPSSTE